MFGANDWTWRAESGDWRFFYLDVPKDAAGRARMFLADTTWEDAAPYTDLDTLIFGRVGEHYQLSTARIPFGAPYILDTVGKSPNTNSGRGVWRSTRRPAGRRDVVTAPAQEGLHALVQHQVGWQGDKFHVPFKTQLGAASVTPSSVGRPRPRTPAAST